MVQEKLSCKHSHVLPLAVKNWLKVPQRFRIEIRAPDKDPSTELQGHDYVDVPASLTREYALSFFAFKEGVTQAEVRLCDGAHRPYGLSAFGDEALTLRIRDPHPHPHQHTLSPPRLFTPSPTTTTTTP